MPHLLLSVAASFGLLQGQPTDPAPPAPTTHILLDFPAADATPLHAKLTLPPSITKPPVVFYLHGASPRTYDVPIPYRDADGAVKLDSYMEYYARELTKRGVAFCRMSKRGCTPSDKPPGMEVDRAIFSKAVPSVLISDYEQGLKTLRARPEIDPARIVIVGGSEGTRLAPQLALRSPDGVIGVVMMAYQGDNARKTVEWQNTIGPWRNVQFRFPGARDDELTRAEYDETLKSRPSAGAGIPFDIIDLNKDGVMKPDELAHLVRPRLDAILKAVETRDDDYLWTNLLNLSSGYLLEYWEAEPTHEILLKLDIPLAIFHGDLDGACRVEGVHETRAAFKAAGKENLTTVTYPESDHDINWSRKAAAEGGVRAFSDEFDLIVRWCRPAEAKAHP